MNNRSDMGGRGAGMGAGPGGYDRGDYQDGPRISSGPGRGGGGRFFDQPLRQSRVDMPPAAGVPRSGGGGGGHYQNYR
jgi:hypothetical protein